MSITPIYDPNRGFRVWHIDQIFTGASGNGKYVPNVDDLVIDFATGYKRVSDINRSTYQVEMVPWQVPENNGLTDTDLMLGVPVGDPSVYLRVRVNKRQTPHTLDVDSAFPIYRGDAKYVKVFRGVDISDNGEVISQVYDQNGNLASENIPLTTAVFNEATNQTLKTVNTAHTNHDLQEGEIVSVVAYSDNGNVLTDAKMTVSLTALVRQVDSAAKVITNVVLETPFLSSTEDRTLLVPSNLPQDSLMLTARVYYQDGSSVRRNIDGGKVKLVGLNSLLTTIPGTVHPLTLIYVLGEDEASTNSQSGAHDYGHIATSYNIKVTAIDTDFSVKLFVVPTWRNATDGYRLEYYLYNLNRDGYYYATPYVSTGDGGIPFDPLRFNETQVVSVSVKLSDVDPALPNFTLAQSFRISLLKSGNSAGVTWTMNYTSDTANLYGQNLTASVAAGVGEWYIDISAGATALSEWLNKVYYPTRPLYDTNSESGPLVPTHFIMSIEGVEARYPISQWDESITTTIGSQTGRALVLHWVREVSGSDLYLGASGMKLDYQS